MKRLFLVSLIVSVLSVFHSTAQAQTCRDLLESPPSQKSWSRYFLPKFIREKFQSSFVRLAAKDARFGVLKLTEVSKNIDAVDNLSSPALLRTLIFHKRADTKVFDYLKNVANRESIVSKNMGQPIPEHVRQFLDMAETKYRLAVEIIKLAYREKTGANLVVTPEAFSLGLVEFLRDSVVEISLNSKSSEFFSEINFRQVDWSRVRQSVQFSLREAPTYELEAIRRMFNIGFLEFIRTDSTDHRQIVATASRALERALANLPVGISYRVRELNSTVRFGNKQFYSSYRMTNSTTRDAYERNAGELGGLIDVELNLSNSKKKLVATLLDRSHQVLDPIGQLENPTDVCFNTCGSFPPILFIKSGVPILASSYVTPVPIFVSLAIQRFLHFGPVKSISLRELSLKDTAIDVAVIVAHDSIPALIETGIYMVTITSVGSAIMSFF